MTAAVTPSVAACTEQPAHDANVVAVVAVSGQRRPVRVTCANVQQAAVRFFGGAPTVRASAVPPVSVLE